MWWLDGRYFQGLWLALGLVAFLSTVTLMFIGQANDWLRMAAYGVVLGLAWWCAKGPWMRAALFSVFVSSYLLVFWIALDSQSMVNRLNLGVLGYGALIAQITLGSALHFGWVGGVFGVLVGLALPVPYPQDGVRAFATFMNLAASIFGTVVYGLLMQLKVAKAQIERVALLDELTGLENRRAMILNFQRYAALASRRNVSLLVSSWDVNDLKRINDSQGHAAGDAHLRQFAKALQSEARLEDVFFRVGGDEFIGLHLGLSDGAELVGRVQARFVWVAGGWCLVGDRGLEVALNEADQMLYANKLRMKAKAVASHQTDSALGQESV